MIAFIHLLNDRSGSPKVLASAIRALCAYGKNAHLYVGSGGTGCLDEVCVPTTRYWYRRSSNRLVTLFAYLFSQLCIFMRLACDRNLPCDAVIYVNTLLPFGAALYGAFTRRHVVYHLHEISVSPAALRWFLTTVARHTADRLIYVSEFHRSQLPIPNVSSVTVHNSLDEKFLIRAKSCHYNHRKKGIFNVLMLASLRDYKGIPEFLNLADQLQTRPDINFHLVANDNKEHISHYFKGRLLPHNITVYSCTQNPGLYYSKSSLLVNLSRTDQWIETFGLTLLEAMAYGVPVIAPPVGGPIELVKDGQEGFLIDSRNSNKLAETILQLADDKDLCLRLSANGRTRASHFSPLVFAQALRDALIFDKSNLT